MLKSLLGLLAALALAAPALAQGADPNRLFADSTLVVRDRFSDEIVGHGPDLVFITGLAASRAVWRTPAERLKGKHRLHLIQIAGFAGEPARANAAGEVLIPTAEAIGAYLVEQKLTPAVLIGQATGGSAILYLAERRPEHVKKALIVDAVPFVGDIQNPPATMESMRSQAERARDRILAAGRLTPGEIEPEMGAMSKDAATRRLIAEWRARSDHTVVARAYYEHLSLDLRPGLASVKTPILVLYPDMAPLGVPPGAMEKAFAALYAPAPGVKTQLVAGSLHFIMLDQPQAFDAALDAFLAQP